MLPPSPLPTTPVIKPRRLQPARQIRHLLIPPQPIIPQILTNRDAKSTSQLLDLVLQPVLDAVLRRARPAAEMLIGSLAVPYYVLAEAVGAPELEVDGVADFGREGEETGDEGGLGLGVG